MNCKYKDVKFLLIKILDKLGAPREISEKVINSLILNDSAGYKSHGIRRIISYAKDARNGNLDVNAVPIINKVSNGVINIDGKNSFGLLVVEEIIKQLSESSKSHALSAITVTNSHHIGRLNTIGSTLAGYPNNLFVIGFCNYLGGGARVAPPGIKSQARLSTNPILLAFPVASENPFVLDMSTSIVSEGTIGYVKECSGVLNSGVLLDHEELPTLDPQKLYKEPPEATLAPLGYPWASHKGYGIAVFTEAIVGILGNAGNICKPIGNGNGLFVIALNPGYFNDNNSGEWGEKIVRSCYEEQRTKSDYRYPGNQNSKKIDEILGEDIVISESIYRELKSLG